MTALIVAVFTDMFVSAFALMQFWNWFVVPSLKAPALTLAPSLGISLLITLIKFNPMDDNVEKAMSKGVGSILFDSISLPIFYLLFGWIISWFM